MTQFQSPGEGWAVIKGQLVGERVMEDLHDLFDFLAKRTTTTTKKKKNCWIKSAYSRLKCAAAIPCGI